MINKSNNYKNIKIYDRVNIAAKLWRLTLQIVIPQACNKYTHMSHASDFKPCRLVVRHPMVNRKVLNSNPTRTSWLHY